MAASCASGARAALLVLPAVVEWRGAPLVPAAAVPAALAVPAAALALPMAAIPSPSAPSDPVAAPIAVVDAAGMAALASPSAPAQPGDPAAASAEALAEALVSGGASPAFLSAVRSHIARTFPPAVLREFLSAGYRVEANAHVSQGRPDLAEDADLVSGYHAHGPDGKLIIIGETVKGTEAGSWERSRIWENAVNHEFGLAIGRVLGDAAAAKVEGSELAGWYRAHGISESQDFREEWRQDHWSIPRELKEEKDEDGDRNDFYDFLRPDKKNGWFQKARALTFAEGLDVLLRGRSAYNYDNFNFNFPRSLARLRREMEARFGWRIPEPPPPPQPHGAWENPDATRRELAEMLVSGAARPEFVATVRAHVARTFPPELIRDLLKGGYRVAADESVRQGREGLHADNDLRGGFHSYGSKGHLIVVAEKLKLIGSDQWVESLFWENAVNHEIGHALAYIHGEAEAKAAAPSDSAQALWYRQKGLSESAAFREAWRRDFEAMPAQLKNEWTPGLNSQGAAVNLQNRFYYFVHPDAGGRFQRARQETLAEAFDVLLRGPRSAMNYSKFTQYFPNTLAELRREFSGRYPGLFP